MKNQIVQALALVFAFSSVSSAFADSSPWTTAPATDTAVTLFTATSDAKPGTMTVQILVDASHNITHFRYLTSVSTVVETFDLANLKAGIVIYQEQGKDVAVLSSQDFLPGHGGHLSMRYISNAINNSHGTFEADLDRTGQDWKVSVNETAGRRYFTKMYLKAKKFFGSVVGVGSVTVN